MKELDAQTVASWVFGLILAWFFVYNGWPKLVPGEAVTTRFQNWGYSQEFARIIGIFELAGAIMVLIPRTAFYGALILMVIMVGAIYTHLNTGIGSPAFAIILFVLATTQALITRRNAAFLAKS